MPGFDDAIQAIQAGEIIGVPTDTLYGVAADPFNQDALEKIFVLKGRPGLKPLALLVASIEQGQELAAFSDRALQLAEDHWPGGLTLVLPRLDSVPDWVGNTERRTVGLRCPDHETAIALLEECGPLAVTSANISGQAPALSDEDARDLFGSEVACYVPGEATGGEASTIIDLTQPAEWVLRDGPVRP